MTALMSKRRQIKQSGRERECDTGLTVGKYTFHNSTFFKPPFFFFFSVCVCVCVGGGGGGGVKSLLFVLVQVKRLIKEELRYCKHRSLP